MCPFNGLFRVGWEVSYLKGLMNQVSYTMALLRIMLLIILSRPCYNYYIYLRNISSSRSKGNI